MIHTKDGKTHTDKTAYIWDIPPEEITSVERTVPLDNGKKIVMSVKKSDGIHNIFVKATQSQDFVMMGNQAGSRPVVVDALAIGFHVGEEPNVTRIEIECDPRTGNVVAHAVKVKQATRDGF